MKNLVESDRWANSRLTPRDWNPGSGRGLDSWFNGLLPLALTLAQVGDGRGLTILVRSVLDWLKDYRRKLTETEALKIMEGSTKATPDAHAALILILDSSTTVVSFLSSVLALFAKVEDSSMAETVLTYDSDLSGLDMDSELQWPGEELG